MILHGKYPAVFFLFVPHLTKLCCAPLPNPQDPCMVNIYLHLVDSMVSVGKYTILGCPGQEVRSKGDRISGFFHPKDLPHL